MPQNEAARIDPLARGPFSRLLFSDSDTLMGFNHHTTSGTFTFSSDQKPPKMLCFGQDYINSNGKINGGSTTTITDDKSSTTNNTTTSLSSNSNMKRYLESEYYQPVNVSTSFTTTEATEAPPVRTTRRNHKKTKTENTPPACHAKVKKEKLGERIAALQQMVSPYGKTDTASVLHEAMGYIKSLQEQVHVLWSPYLKRLPTTHIEGKEDRGGERKKDLRSQGLCLVPFDCTHHVAESNGDDLWSPAMVNRQGGSSALH